MALPTTASAQPPSPTPSPTAETPLIEWLGPERVRAWRIESVWECGGSMSRCLHAEPEALVLARVAMGEAPHSVADRIFVMWSIKLRAALGFKEALPGYLAQPDRWGPETSIYVEALCNGGCQYAPVRAAEAFYFPCAELPQHHALRPMLCPSDEQLMDFNTTVEWAEMILSWSLDQMPERLRGYESFRSPQVTWHGQINREGGLRSQLFFPGGNIWRDEYPQDNEFWQTIPTRTPFPTVRPTVTPRPSATRSATATPSPTDGVYAAEAAVWIDATEELAMAEVEDKEGLLIAVTVFVGVLLIVAVGHLIDTRIIRRLRR